jgi:predicted DsbA family dithiol-disulfide isomerase
MVEPLGADVHESLLDKLFESYFVHGLNLGDDQVLEQLAQTLGLDLSNADDLDTPPIWHLPEGASGVPLFVLNEQQAISGAQAPEVLLSAMLQTVQACA